MQGFIREKCKLYTDEHIAGQVDGTSMYTAILSLGLLLSRLLSCHPSLVSHHHHVLSVNKLFKSDKNI